MLAPFSSASARQPVTVDVTVLDLDLPDEVRAVDIAAEITRRLTARRERARERDLAEVGSHSRRADELLQRMRQQTHDVLPEDPLELDCRLARWIRTRPALTMREERRIDDDAALVAWRRNRPREDALGALAGDSKDKDRRRERVSRLIGPVPAIAIASEAQADELAAALHAEMPWMAPATEACWRAMRRSARDGAPLRIGPLLLDGPPGIGKTTWAHRLAEMLQLPSVELDAAKGLASFSLTGTERGWASSQPGRPLDKMMDSGIANPLVIIDEIDKTGRSLGTSAAFEPALLGLLEPESARNWDCPFHRLQFDMSHLSWVLTSNWLLRVSEPVRSRVQVLSLPLPTVAELQAFARRQATAAGLPAPAAEALCEAVGQAGKHWEMSLRDVGRMLARAQDLAGTPTVH